MLNITSLHNQYKYAGNKKCTDVETPKGCQLAYSFWYYF